MLTFEMLRELERNEKESRQLQQLPDNLIADLRDYIKIKGELKETTDILELENVRNTVKRLIEIRERKIVDLAIYSARTGLPPENLAPNEEDFFNQIVEQLKKFRTEFFDDLDKTKIKQEKIKYIVKKNTPEIIGPDLKKYKLNENEVIDDSTLPKELNDLLIKQGIIEKINE